MRISDWSSDVCSSDLLDAADEAVEAMVALCAAVEIPQGLSSLGVTDEVIPYMAVEAAGIERLMRNNPRKLSARDIEKIYRADRKSVVKGRSVSVRVDLGGRSTIKKKIKK